MSHPLIKLVRDQKNGIMRGIVSLCSANRFVLQAAMKRARGNEEYVLIEATANQVNQFGGYTGMKPADFVSFVHTIAEEQGFNKGRLILGGDHLGPLTWSRLSEKEAMDNASELIRGYVLAGFTKIHIDTSMKLADDAADKRLSDEVIAQRGALLCKVAEETYFDLKKELPDAAPLVYVIGSEVPVPGGAHHNDEGISVTSSENFKNTIDAFEKSYNDFGLREAFERVIAVVVQPGVEFSDSMIMEYDRAKASKLIDALKDYRSIVFEGHSTDYQTQENLRYMVEDGIAILKVGPALTFALREALFSLELIEHELSNIYRFTPSDFINTLEKEMVDNTSFWIKHYHGSEQDKEFKRKYSYSDRCRYYLPVKAVDDSVHRLLDNLSKTEIPMQLISQYMPIQYEKVQAGRITSSPEELLMDRVIDCVDQYAFACTGDKAYR